MCAARFLTEYLFFAHVVLGVGTARRHSIAILTHVVHTVHEVLVKLHCGLLVVAVGHIRLDLYVVAIAFDLEVVRSESAQSLKFGISIVFGDFLFEFQVIPFREVFPSSSIVWQDRELKVSIIRSNTLSIAGSEGVVKLC